MDTASVLEGVSSAVQSVIGKTPATEQPLMECGLDSLGAVELRNSLAARFSLTDLPATLTYDYPTVEAIANFIAGKLTFLPTRGACLASSAPEHSTLRESQ